jgi:hypothetical protein
MRKSDKKIDNQIIKALTEVCQSALEDIDGFQWLTHTVNFEKMPQSLRIVCVFDSNKNLVNCLKSDNSSRLKSLIANSLADIGIELSNTKNQIELDSEENCTLHCGGNWSKRLS